MEFQFTTNQECGVLEIADTLLSHLLFGIGSIIVIKWPDFYNDPSISYMKNKNELLKLSNNAISIVQVGSITITHIDQNNLKTFFILTF